MSLSASEELELLALLEAEAQYEAGRKLWQYFPDDGPYRRALYSKHLAFFAAGAHYPMRLMLKGNRVGGTEGFGCELTYHLTGDYPPWWEGKRFDPSDCGLGGRRYEPQNARNYSGQTVWE